MDIKQTISEALAKPLAFDQGSPAAEEALAKVTTKGRDAERALLHHFDVMKRTGGNNAESAKSYWNFAARNGEHKAAHREFAKQFPNHPAADFREHLDMTGLSKHGDWFEEE